MRNSANYFLKNKKRKTDCGIAEYEFFIKDWYQKCVFFRYLHNLSQTDDLLVQSF